MNLTNVFKESLADPDVACTMDQMPSRCLLSGPPMSPSLAICSLSLSPSTVAGHFLWWLIGSVVRSAILFLHQMLELGISTCELERYVLTLQFYHTCSSFAHVGLVTFLGGLAHPCCVSNQTWKMSRQKISPPTNEDTRSRNRHSQR